MTDLDKLQKLVVDFRNEREWQQFHTPKDSAITLVLEATELLEHFQWKNQEEIAQHLSSNREDVSEELADVLYWVLIMANDFNISLENALTKKIIKNNAKYPVSKAKGNHTKYTEL